MRPPMRWFGAIAGLAVSLLGPGLANAMPLQWLQQMTGCSQISGYEPLLESPVVTYYENGRFQPERILQFNNDGTQVELRMNLQTGVHFLVVDYSPFLHSYAAVEPDTTGTGDHDQWVGLPPLNSKLRSGGKIIPKLVLTVRKNGFPVPGAMVMFDSGVIDDDPYAMQADSAGRLEIYCYQWPSHTPEIYVMTDDDEFPAAISLDKSDQQLATGSIDPVLNGTTTFPSNNNNTNMDEKSDDPSLEEPGMKDSN
jgi:hypothetical protein